MSRASDIKYIKSHQRQANKRLTSLKNYEAKKGRDFGGRSYALDIARESLKGLGIDKFGVIEGQSDENLSRQARAIRRLNESVTGTVSGIKKNSRQLRKNASTVGIKIKSGIEQNLFEEFLEHQLIQELIQFDSGRGFAAVEYAIKNAKFDFEALDRAWEEYKKGELKFDEALEEWIEINPLLHKF